MEVHHHDHLWDLISHDEMFSDIHQIWEISDGLWLEVEGKMVSRTEGNIDDSLIGGNASAAGSAAGPEAFTKEAYKKFIKNYMKSPFMTGAAGQIEHILANFKSLLVKT
ncbi:unnamed protein product [Nyctereutes procyonoides]|uniref:Translationally-controlled tumor protein n=1 Tax=Nyctereutes procyonoides TaxID=34880 RepID=A0A811ZB94_NYCPR|nr:unnamed protein product [Nyctereutes procyonoides]